MQPANKVKVVSTQKLSSSSHLSQNYSSTITPSTLEVIEDPTVSSSKESHTISPSEKTTIERPMKHKSPEEPKGVREESRNLFKSLFGRKKKRGTELQEDTVSKTIAPNKQDRTNAASTPIIQKNQPSVTKEVSEAQGVGEFCPKNVVAYKKVLEMLHQYIIKSHGNTNLTNDVASEIKVFLNNVLCNKNAPEVLIANLSNLFMKFQNQKECTLNSEQQGKVVRYMNELRNSNLESFKQMRVELKKRCPSLFVDTQTTMLVMPQLASSNDTLRTTPDVSGTRTQRVNWSNEPSHGHSTITNIQKSKRRISKGMFIVIVRKSIVPKELNIPFIIYEKKYYYSIF